MAAVARESSVTVPQIVARQEENYRRIKNCQGTVIWSESTPGASTAAQSSRVIFFAFEDGNSVNLVLPYAESRVYAKGQGKINWGNVIAANLIQGDNVLTVRQQTKTSEPQILKTPFNPAVHENNPLVAFHPRQLGDERVPLRELAASIPQMPTRPKVTDVQREGQLYVRVDFNNANSPGEVLYYILNPAKAYLPVEIGRISNGHTLSLSRITIGNTKDGTWIPARRERGQYDQSGKSISVESWHYEYLAVNEGLARRMLSPAFFQLPSTTPVVSTGDARKPGPGARAIPPTPSNHASPSRGTATPASNRTMPMRTQGTPLIVPLP